jgi:hypothetical protein
MSVGRTSAFSALVECKITVIIVHSRALKSIGLPDANSQGNWVGELQVRTPSWLELGE